MGLGPRWGAMIGKRPRPRIAGPQGRHDAEQATPRRRARSIGRVAAGRTMELSSDRCTSNANNRRQAYLKSSLYVGGTMT